MRCAGLLCVLTCLLIGCSSTPTGEGAKTGTSLTVMADRLDAARVQLATTMQNLDTLTSTTEGDPAPAYKAFADSVNALDKRAQAVQSSADAIENKSKAYFEQWEEELASINNEDIRKQSQARKDKVQQGIGKVRKQYDELADLYTPLMADLRDLVAVLKTDLTVAGVKSIERPAREAHSSANKVMSKAEELENSFRELGLAMSGG